MAQRFGFGLADSLLAEMAGVSHYSLHYDIDAMCKAADAGAELAKRLGADPPKPHLYGMSYVHVSTLGAEVINGPDLPEPWVRPSLRTPADIDGLREPADYLACPMVRDRLALAERLKARRPDAGTGIGHDFEGPATTAVLLLGPQFFMLPYDDPARAHTLMAFVTTSAINYTRALRKRQGRSVGGPEGICDDFAGMFRPELFRQFVQPYWERMYSGLGATQRYLHSELLHEEHLPSLKELRLTEYDPSVDQYLPPEALKRSCQVPFTLRIWPAWVLSKPAAELVEIYRHLASFHPTVITFHLAKLAELPKIEALLKVARELE